MGKHELDLSGVDRYCAEIWDQRLRGENVKGESGSAEISFEDMMIWAHSLL